MQSVLRQPYKKIEVVLVDDGSADGSSEICDSLASGNERITALHQENGGVSVARNAGIDFILNHQLRKENYIAFLDADDVWMPDFFNDEILDLLNKGYDLLGFSSAVTNMQMTKRRKAVHGKLGAFKGGSSSVKPRPETFAAIFYSAALLDSYNIRFMENVKYSEDQIFRLENMFLCHEMYFAEKLLYLYRNNIKSAVHNRHFGCSYYVPLLKVYLRMDTDMKKWSNRKRGTCVAGREIADFYVQDMICEHFQHFGSAKSLFNTAKENEILFKNNTEIMEKLKTRRFRISFIAKNYLKGAGLFILKKIYHFSPVSGLINKRRYTEIIELE